MLTLAREAGIPSAESRVEQVGDRDVLLVKRFDRRFTNEGYHRARMVSALTLLRAGEMPDDRGRWSYVLLAEELRRISARPQADARELFRRGHGRKNGLSDLAVVLPHDRTVGEMCRHRTTGAGPRRPELAAQNLRNELVGRHPELLPRYLAVLTDIEAAFTEAVAERMGIDPELDPLPGVLVAATMSATSAAIRWWERSDRTRSLRDVYAESFAVVTSIDPLPDPTPIPKKRPR